VGSVLLAATLPFSSATNDLGAALAGIGLGLAIGALTAPEHVARRGRFRVAIVWAAALGLPMVLAAGVQATYAEHALASGPRVALEATYLRTWLVLYDPRTLPTAALWTFALALAPLVRGAGRDARAWTTAATIALVVAAPSLSSGPRGAVGVAFVLLLVSLLACAFGDAIARGRGAPDAGSGDAEPPRTGATLIALATVLTLVATLARFGLGPPLASQTGWLLEADDPAADPVLARLELEDAEVVDALVTHLEAPRARRRAFAAGALGELDPPVRRAAVDALARALVSGDRAVMHAAARSLEVLEPAAREAGPLLFRLLTRPAPFSGLFWLNSSGVYVTDGNKLRRLDLWDDDVLLDLCEDPDVVVADAALELLTVTPAMFPRVERFLAVPARRERAALKIAQTGEPALALLRERLARPGVEADPVLAVMLNLPQSLASLTLLGDALAHPSSVVREHAARGLRADGPRGAWRGGADLLRARLAVDPADYLHDALATYPRREER
jgi:hypothetical protein